MAGTRRIGIVLFDGVEELDAVGPWEVFGFWAEHVASQPWELVALAQRAGPVRGAKRLVVHAECALADAPPLDILLHPGGQGTRPLAVDDEHLSWLRARRADTPLLTSVCTGSLVYAAAGLLRDRPATTHWASLDRLAELDPTIEVRAEDRFVDDGDMVTSAGVSAGIDMALHLVSRLGGPDEERAVRRGIQY